VGRRHRRTADHHAVKIDRRRVIIVVVGEGDSVRSAGSNPLEVGVDDLRASVGRVVKVLGRQCAAGQQREAKGRDKEVVDRPHQSILPD
jgi:hypothetical protein